MIKKAMGYLMGIFDSDKRGRFRIYKPFFKETQHANIRFVPDLVFQWPSYSPPFGNLEIGWRQFPKYTPLQVEELASEKWCVKTTTWKHS